MTRLHGATMFCAFLPVRSNPRRPMSQKSSWSDPPLVRWRALAAALAASLLALAPCASAAASLRDPGHASGNAAIDLAALPPAACATLALIQKGGPFPYPQDGATFVNREQRLPSQARGYYTEYTVRTPGSRDRGARRIVAGRGLAGDPQAQRRILVHG